MDYASPRYGTPGWGVFFCVLHPRRFKNRNFFNYTLEIPPNPLFALICPTYTEMLAPICFMGDTMYFRPFSEPIVRHGFVRGGVWQNPGFNTIWRYRLYLILWFSATQVTHPSLFMHRFFPPHTESQTPFNFHENGKLIMCHCPPKSIIYSPETRGGVGSRTRWSRRDKLGKPRVVRLF